ncbi:MAG: molybdopterin-binding protein [Chloroflexota bacterium]
MRLERISPGRAIPAGLAGAILARDLVIAGQRMSKGRRLTAADLEAIAAAPVDDPEAASRTVPVLVLEPWDVHEDEAATRLAEAVARGRRGLQLQAPVQSRVDLVAAVAGVVDVRISALERLNRLDPLEVFTVFDGQVVAPGDLVASVKIAPHAVPAAILESGIALAGRGAPIVRVRPFRNLRIAAVAKGPVTAATRGRFENAVRTKVTGLGATLAGLDYVVDDVDAVTHALSGWLAPGPGQAAIVLTAGGVSTDPGDAFFAAVEALGGRVVRHGVPSHPGSMLWLARVGRAAVIGLPSCGAYSMATAADLLLARLVAGEPASAATVARLAHGGILARTQRFRFPGYARDLEPPES